MLKNEREWGLEKWKIFVDSPMGIEATSAYAHYRNLYGADLFRPGSNLPNSPNITMTRSAEESVARRKSVCGVSTTRYVHKYILLADCRHMRIRPICLTGMVPLKIDHPSTWYTEKSGHRYRWRKNYKRISMRLSQ